MPSQNEGQWNAMLNRLAQRNGSVDLSCGVDNDQSAVITYRSRIFEVQADGSIVIEMPRQAKQDRAFRIGQSVDLTLISNDERMVATCTLHEVLTYAVNRTLDATCYRLSAGRQPMREQRRSFFRVNVAAMDFKPAMLRSEIEDKDEKPFEFNARLVNISIGGIGVIIRAEHRILDQIKRTRRFNCTACLIEDDEIDVPVRVVYINALGDDGLYLGLQFEIEDEARAADHEQAMQQRGTEIQRIQLRRRRA